MTYPTHAEAFAAANSANESRSPGFNDRRSAIGSGDFNNPRGTFEVVSPGYAEQDRWGGMSHTVVRNEVHKYFQGQKDTKTWQEATRLAKRRTDHQFRGAQTANGAQYADAYQDHLVRVMAIKGKGLADGFGELQHRQSGYGRA